MPFVLAGKCAAFIFTKDHTHTLSPIAGIIVQLHFIGKMKTRILDETRILAVSSLILYWLVLL